MHTFVAYTLRNIIVKNEVDWVIFKKEVGFSVEVCVPQKKCQMNLRTLGEKACFGFGFSIYHSFVGFFLLFPTVYHVLKAIFNGFQLI